MADENSRVIKTEIVQWPVGGRSKKTYPVEFTIVSNGEGFSDEAISALANLLLDIVEREDTLERR